MQFGDILRELLENRGITQKELAENFVRNLREPDYKTLKRIAAYFDVSIDFLLNYNKENKEDFHREEKLLQIFRALDTEKQNILIEQGQILVKYQRMNNGK